MLILIIGSVGSGKTLFMVMMAHQNYKRKVYANFYINHPKWKRLYTVDILSVPDDTDVYLDEAYTKLEKRRSMNSTNVIYSHILNQRRKTNSIWYLSEQTDKLIDLRFEKYANIIVKCFPRYSKYDDFIYEYNFDYTDEKLIEIYSYDEMKVYFNLFNTNEIVEPEMKDKIEYDLMKDIPELLPIKVKEIYNRIKKDITTGSKPDIKMCLISNKIYYKWTDYVHIYHQKFKKPIKKS